MNNLIIAVVIYAVLAVIQFGFGIYYNSESYRERFSRSLFAANGVDINDDAAVLVFMRNRYDSDSIANRLADFIGWLWQGISWINAAIVFCIFVSSSWKLIVTHQYVYSAGETVLYCAVWSVFMYLLGILVSMICKLITNRYPKEPHGMRKIISKHI